MAHLLLQADARRIPLADKSVQCCITSPPYYGLRDYGTATWVGGDSDCDHRESKPSRAASSAASSGLEGSKGSVHRSHVFRGDCLRCGARRIDCQIGLEPSPDEYVATMVAVFREVRRVLRDDGTLWMNLGDSYANDTKWGGNGGNPTTKNYTSGLGGCVGQKAKRNTGLKPKDLCLIPERVAMALQRDGWFLRAKPPWIKPSAMPESVEDRPTNAHESIYLFSKSQSYYYDADAVRMPMAEASASRYAYAFGGCKAERMTAEEAEGPGTRTHPIGFREPSSGRNRRSTDWFTESLDELIGHHEAYLSHLRKIRDEGGMLAGENGEPLAFKVAAQPWKGSHFAVFPPRLVEPMVKASTSEAGACPACGSPYTRIVEREPMLIKRSGRGEQMGEFGRTATSGTMVSPPRATTRGWEPSCCCNAGEPVPCVVLDPFAGAATTLVVAESLGRHGIGLDLNPEYLRMGKRRLERPHAPVETARSEEPMPLFRQIGNPA